MISVGFARVSKKRPCRICGKPNYAKSGVEKGVGRVDLILQIIVALQQQLSRKLLRIVGCLQDFEEPKRIESKPDRRCRFIYVMD